MASDSYFAALGVPVVRGRAFTVRDGAGAPPVAIINETMAKRYWPNRQDPLGDRLVAGEGTNELTGDPERRVVGIVGDVRYRGLAKDFVPTIYVPIAQVTPPFYALIANGGVDIAWVVRTRDESAATALAIRKTIREATGLPVVNVAPLERVISDSVSRERLNMLLMSIFGGAALLLSAIGIYGLMAYSVQQRVQEIGIRIALGAETERVRRMIVWQGMVLVVIGIAGGLLSAFYAAGVLASFLFGIRPRDPVVFVFVPVMLALIGLLSVWLPAVRASRVNPLEALRHE
jgi:putative ABC transport system permease protein